MEETMKKKSNDLCAAVKVVAVCCHSVIHITANLTSWAQIRSKINKGWHPEPAARRPFRPCLLLGRDLSAGFTSQSVCDLGGLAAKANNLVRCWYQSYHSQL